MKRKQIDFGLLSEIQGSCPIFKLILNRWRYLRLNLSFDQQEMVSESFSELIESLNRDTLFKLKKFCLDRIFGRYKGISVSKDGFEFKNKNGHDLFRKVMFGHNDKGFTLIYFFSKIQIQENNLKKIEETLIQINKTKFPFNNKANFRIEKINFINDNTKNDLKEFFKLLQEYIKVWDKEEFTISNQSYKRIKEINEDKIYKEFIILNSKVLEVTKIFIMIIMNNMKKDYKNISHLQQYRSSFSTYLDLLNNLSLDKITVLKKEIYKLIINTKLNLIHNIILLNIIDEKNKTDLNCPIQNSSTGVLGVFLKDYQRFSKVFNFNNEHKLNVIVESIFHNINKNEYQSSEIIKVVGTLILKLDHLLSERSSSTESYSELLYIKSLIILKLGEIRLSNYCENLRKINLDLNNYSNLNLGKYSLPADLRDLLMDICSVNILMFNMQDVIWHKLNHVLKNKFLNIKYNKKLLFYSYSLGAYNDTSILPLELKMDLLNSISVLLNIVIKNRHSDNFIENYIRKIIEAPTNLSKIELRHKLSEIEVINKIIYSPMIRNQSWIRKKIFPIIKIYNNPLLRAV